MGCATCVQTGGIIDLAEIHMSGYPTLPQSKVMPHCRKLVWRLGNELGDF